MGRDEQKEVQDLVGPDALAVLIREAPEGMETAFHVLNQMTGEGKDAVPQSVLKIERRTLQAEQPKPPIRRESPPRAHVFRDAQGFSDYLDQYGGEHTVVLADPASGMISAILDERAATGTETISLSPMIHPTLRPWVDLMAAGPTALEEFVLFLARNRRAVVKPDGKVLALTLSQVRCATTVTLQRGRGAKSVNGLKIATDIQGEKGEELTDLPDVLTLDLPIFVDSAPRKIEFDLTLQATPDGQKIAATLTSADLDAMIVAEFQSMVDTIRGDGDERVVGLGRPAYAEWKYLAYRDGRTVDPDTGKAKT